MFISKSASHLKCPSALYPKFIFNKSFTFYARILLCLIRVSVMESDVTGELREKYIVYK